jgi:8-oxo-dGTP pyrophosphatase MutT (NUDIX family)
MYATGVLLETSDKKLIFQLRDDIPTIRDPGKVSVFGGHAEPEDNGAIGTAIRELQEEIGVSFNLYDFEYLLTCNMALSLNYPNIFIYIVKNVDPNITVYEGSGPIIVSKEDDLTKINFAPLARLLINLYWGI